MRQYDPKKPHKWGFKNLVRAGQLGMICDFFIYGGKSDNGGNPLTAKDIVLNCPKIFRKMTASNYTLTTGFQPWN